MSILDVALGSDVLVFVTNDLDGLETLFANENRGYGHTVEFLAANVKKHGELSVTHASVPAFITRYAMSCLHEFIQSDIGEVTLQILHDLVSSRGGRASAASQLAALGAEAYSKRMSDKGKAGVAAKKKALGAEAYSKQMSELGRASAAARFLNLDLEASIREAIRHQNSVKKAVKTIYGMDEIVRLRRSISSLSFGGASKNCDMYVIVSAWSTSTTQRRNRQRLYVNFELHDFSEVSVDEVKRSFSSIISVWKNNSMFLRLKQWEIEAALLKIFGFTTLELSIREAIRNKTSVDEVVKTIRRMDEIVELRRSIRSLSFPRSWNRSIVCSVGITYWQNRSGDCTTNPVNNALHVIAELKRGGKSANLQIAIKAVLIVWRDVSRINCMNWDEIEELLYKTFKPKTLI